MNISSSHHLVYNFPFLEMSRQLNHLTIAKKGGMQHGNQNKNLKMTIGDMKPTKRNTVTTQQWGYPVTKQQNIQIYSIDQCLIGACPKMAVPLFPVPVTWPLTKQWSEAAQWPSLLALLPENLQHLATTAGDFRGELENSSFILSYPELSSVNVSYPQLSG